jgi:hypothetical protein
MADLSKLTLRALRDLARKHLGRGQSRLKTRRALIEALEEVLPALPAPAAPSRVAALVPKRKTNGRAPATIVGTESAAPPTATRRAERKTGAQAATREASSAPVPATQVASAQFEERLGELPETYGEDAVILLPKDPHCLYLYWDFAPTTVDRAFAWMPEARARLRLLDGERVLREFDVALDAKAWYLHGLPSSHTYKAELLARAEDGQVRRIGPSSNPVRLPAVGPSRFRDDRFVRVPFDLPAGQLAEILRQGLKGAGPLAAASAQASSAPGGRGSAAALRSALVRFVEAPPFSEETRAHLYDVSGGAARALGSSENQPPAPDEPPGDPRGEGPSPWGADGT